MARHLTLLLPFRLRLPSRLPCVASFTTRFPLIRFLCAKKAREQRAHDCQARRHDVTAAMNTAQLRVGRASRCTHAEALAARPSSLANAAIFAILASTGARCQATGEHFDRTCRPRGLPSRRYAIDMPLIRGIMSFPRHRLVASVKVRVRHNEALLLPASHRAAYTTQPAAVS